MSLPFIMHSKVCYLKQLNINVFYYIFKGIIDFKIATFLIIIDLDKFNSLELQLFKS